MRKEIGLQNLVIIVLAIAVLAMSIGFATYSTQLNVTGTATFNRASWSVHFDDTTYQETTGTGYVASSAHTIDDDDITYTVTLPAPGSTFAFSVNVVNDGTIDAKLKKITMGGLSDAQKEYVTYTVNYAGTNYTATTDNIGTLLAATGTTTASVTVTVSYVYPEDPTDLPSTDQNVTLTLSLDYVDANTQLGG